jgi:hypothetical protein
VAYKLLDQFERLFRGARYRHRVSNQGDEVAGYLYEDLFDLDRSPKLLAGIAAQRLVLNKKNVAIGKHTRRGDGTFGERVPVVPAVSHDGLAVAIGEIATVEIGVEVKILAKAMIKQIDRVCTDMERQRNEFRRHNPKAVCVAVVGINHAAKYVGFEKDKEWPTDGKKYKHPIQEAVAAERHIQERVLPLYDETVILRFVAENIEPFGFRWVDPKATLMEYSAALVRISRRYDERF